MIRNVMVFATARLTPNPRGAGSGASRSARGVGVLGSHTASTADWIPRRNLGRYAGASTAAAPITIPGISAASNNAAPAAIVRPAVRYRFMLSALASYPCAGPALASTLLVRQRA